MKFYISCLKPKIIFYRNYKSFHEEKFVKDVKAADFSFSNDDPNEKYSVLSDTFSKLADKHAPLKMKIQRGNHAPFISKEMRKAIYTGSRLRNKFCKNLSEENERKYKRQRNLCVSLRRKAIKQYFSNITSKGIVTNKEFWKTIKPFLTNKGCLENSDIMLINDEEMVTDNETLAKTFNEHYINIVEWSSGLKPEKMEFDNSLKTSRNILHSIIDRYKNHPSILKIKSEVSSKPCSDRNFSRNILVTSDEVEKMLKFLNSKKAAGTDRLPIKLVKLTSEVLSKPLSLAINNSITSFTFPERAKVATVVPIYQKAGNKYTVSNFRPVSLLNCFSKIYENYIKSHIVNSMNNYISPYVSAYRKGYNSQHVLIRLLEKWRQHLDNNKVAGGVSMDLSKAFDCVPHDLFIAKLAAYSVDENLLMYIYSYLSNRKQCVRIINVHSRFQNIISGVPQGSIVSPRLFNCFFNDFFYFIDIASVHNFADDNSLSAFESNIKNLKLILESESKTAISWFQSNKMIVNPGKFQSIIFDKKKQNHTAEYISIDQKNIKTSSSVKLLGVHIDDELNFNLHITKVCRSAANQLHALIRLQMFLNFEEKKTLINSYFYSNFNYCPLVWIFSSAKSLNKVESLLKRALSFLYEDYVSPYDELFQKAVKETMKANIL